MFEICTRAKAAAHCQQLMVATPFFTKGRVPHSTPPPHYCGKHDVEILRREQQIRGLAARRNKRARVWYYCVHVETDITLLTDRSTPDTRVRCRG